MPYEKVGKNDPVCIADEVPFEIPESWEWVRLFNLGDNINDAFADGPFGSNLKKEHYTDRKEVRLIQLSNIGEEGWRNENTKYTTYSHAETLSRSMVKPGAIVIAKMMPAGRAIIVPDCEKDYILSSDAVKFIPHNLLNVNYLVIAINSPAFRNQVVSEAHGVTRIRTSLGKLQTYLLPVPPLSEQQRIVNQFRIIQPLIKEYEIAEGKRISLNEAFPELLKKSILQQAVMGKLVPQDPNDEPASVLLERIRAEKEALIKAGKLKKDKHESIIYRRDNSHYEKQNDEDKCIDEILPFDIPDTWCWCRLNDLCETIFDIDHNMPKADPNGVLFLSAKDLLDDGSLNFDIDVKRISRVDFERLSRKGTPRKGDIIYSRIGACLGKARIVNTNIEFLVSYSCCTIRPMIINTQYLKILLDGGFVLSQAIEKTQSIGVPDLGMQMIKDFLIPLPPLDEQRRIVEKYTCCLEIIGTIS